MIESPRSAGASAPSAPRPLPGLAERALRAPLLGKLAGANLIIVVAAVLAVVAERRSMLPGTAVPILGVALALSLVVSLALVYVALPNARDSMTLARLAERYVIGPERRFEANGYALSAYELRLR